MRRIAMVCQKGGCSKTTTTTAVGVGLARRGHAVLCIDADPQGNAARARRVGGGKAAPPRAARAGLARRGHAVLCIDADPQGNASWTLLGGQGAAPPTLAHLLTRRAARRGADAR